MNAEHAGYARVDGGLHGAHRARHHVEIVADQRGQEAGRAEAAVRGADGANGLDARIVVEQHAAAAVHLRVDEARQQQIAAKIAPDGVANARVGVAHDIDDVPALEQHGAALDEAGIEHHAAVDQRGHPHHSVSVTLFRNGGRSGSRPRAIESAFAMR